MAYIEKTNDLWLPTFYNVSRPVGRGCHNWEEDVMVVQFFLQRMYKTDILGTKPKGDLKVDGIFGNITRNWILKFQLDVQQLQGASIYPDGIISTATDGNLDSSITKTRYTIIYLNGGVKKNDPVVYNNLTSHPEVPPKLRAAFYEMQVNPAVPLN